MIQISPGMWSVDSGRGLKSTGLERFEGSSRERARPPRRRDGTSKYRYKGLLRVGSKLRCCQQPAGHWLQMQASNPPGRPQWDRPRGPEQGR